MTDAPLPAPTPQDTLSVTRHTATIGGEELRYTVTTGTVVLKEEGQKDGVAEGEKPKAAVFFVAYTLEGADPGVVEPLGAAVVDLLAAQPGDAAPPAPRQ